MIDVSRPVLRFLQGRFPTGIDRVCQAYLAHYRTRARALVRFRGSSLIFSRAISGRLFETLQALPSRARAKTVATLVAHGTATSPLSRVAAGSVLLHPGHSGLESETYSRLLRDRRLAAVILVHDLIPLTHPEFSRPGEREKHAARMQRALSAARAIVTNSQATLNDLSAFAAARGTPLPPASVALLGSGPAPGKPGPRPLAGRYFVMLGTIEPRKNHWLLLQVWRRLVERLGKNAPKLVLIGRRGWECENVVDMLERCEALRGVVLELSACADAEMTTYLHHAQALLFPSFVEGYGLPVQEALTQGVPVIASSLAVFREFAGDVPEYLDPLDAPRWLETVLDFTAPRSALRAAQLERLAKYRPPVWAQHFARVDHLLHDVLQRPAVAAAPLLPRAAERSAA